MAPLILIGIISASLGAGAALMSFIDSTDKTVVDIKERHDELKAKEVEIDKEKEKVETQDH